MESANVHSILKQHLQQLRRRLLWIGAASAGSWSVLTAALCVSIGIWLDLVFELSPVLRQSILALTAISTVVVAFLNFGSVWRASSADAMARRLDRAGSTVGEIRSGCDLALAPAQDAARWSSMAQGLVDLAIERAARLAGGIDHRQAAPLVPFMWALARVTLVVLAILTTTLTSGRMMQTEYWRFRDPYGDHPPYSRVAFNVEPKSGSVIYGGHQEIKVVTSGPTVNRLELVVWSAIEPVGPVPIAESGKDRVVYNERGVAMREEVLPMFAEPGGSWRATIADITKPLSFFVRCESGRSKRCQLDVITLPKLETVRMRITPPAYTNRGAYEGGLPPNGIAGLPGAQVQLWAKSNRPLSAGRIDRLPTGSLSGNVIASASIPDNATPNEVATEAADRTSIVMAPEADDEHEVTGTFTIESPGKIEIRIRDVAGQESQDVWSASIVVLKDDRPFVRLLNPPPVSMATPNVELPVVVAAEDDYGISRLSLFRSLNESRALPVNYPTPTPAPTRDNKTTSLAFPTYGLRPGDEIKLYARVEDNDPAGAKGSESAIAVVRIISQEEYERMVMTKKSMEVLQSKYEKARRQMEKVVAQIEELKKQLEKLPPESPLAKEMQQKLAELSKQMRQTSEDMQKSAQSKLPFDIDKKMNQELENLAEKLDQAADEVDELAKPPEQNQEAPTAGEAQQSLSETAKSLGQKKKEYQEKTTEPLDELARVYRLMADQQRFTALYQRQKSLADRLESLKDNDSGNDPAVRNRMQDMEAEQYQIREDLRDLLANIEQHVQQLPEKSQYDPLRKTASEFVDGVRESGASEAMSEAETGLASFSGSRGAQGSREAEQILSKFIGKCKGVSGQGQACMKFSPSLSEGMGNTVEQLLAQAGMNVGNEGTGSGGGYSASSTTLDNVGLFGSTEALGGGDLDGELRKGREGAVAGTAGYEGNFENGEPGHYEPGGMLRSAGAGGVYVPAEYQQRVGDYFERITNEVGSKDVGSRTSSKDVGSDGSAK